MKKKYWPYYIALALVLTALYFISAEANKKEPEWREDYTYASKEPYGCYVTRDYVENMLHSDVRTLDETAFDHLFDNSYSNTNYVFVNGVFEPSKEDVEELCKYVSAGNNVFISARNFGELGDSLDVQTLDNMMIEMNNNPSTVHGLIDSSYVSTEANLFNPALHLQKNAQFRFTHTSSVLVRFDTAHVVILGGDERGRANYIRVPFGQGSFFLHTLPDAFVNYYAAQHNNADYLFGVLSYLPDQPTILDEHYKFGRKENTDPRRYLLQEPALRLAYITLIIAGLVALFFGGKRKQRAVPVVAPVTNTTLEFVEQVGALYYSHGNHSDIMLKKINYFLESVRARFYVSTNVFDEKFLERIENLSGIPAGPVRTLFAAIDHYRISVCSENDLKKLESLIWDFNQRSKR
ncbi:MAG TPA: DUF4350 domain-containing protein [Bacteroidia bacterium]|nr:DUF4350 domain-containing protein [Bacteroidia bacterium]